MRSWRAHLALLALALCSACARCSPSEAPPPAPAPVAAPVPAPPAAPEPPPAPAPTARVVASIGVVEVRRVGAQDWSRLSTGEALAKHDVVRTGGDAEIEITVDEVKVRLYEDSELKLREVESNALEGEALGRVEGEVNDGRGRLELRPQGSDAVLRSDGGRFSMTADGRGIVAVASVRGTVKLAAQDTEVLVPAGREARLRPGKGLEKPQPTLARVLLKVDWPGRETRLKEVPVQGKVQPGSRVLVQGRRVAVEEDGTFRAEVPLAQGRQRVSVTAVDVLGRRKTQHTRILRDDRLEVGVREKPTWSD